MIGLSISVYQQTPVKCKSPHFLHQCSQQPLNLGELDVKGSAVRAQRGPADLWFSNVLTSAHHNRLVKGAFAASTL